MGSAASDHTGTSPECHPLNRVIWNALVSRHQIFAQGDKLARRYPVTIGPFGATADETPESYESLARLIAERDRLALFTAQEIFPPRKLAVVKRDLVDQMVLDFPPASRGAPPLVSLGPEDIQEMRHLVDLTQPGPFGPRTIELGRYLGIRADGRLVAMAGERMKVDGFTEISAVCVHPNYRGSGLAGLLIAALARSIAARREVPFLHVFASNTPAITLYLKLGFVRRRGMHLAVLQQRFA